MIRDRPQEPGDGVRSAEDCVPFSLPRSALRVRRSMALAILTGVLLVRAAGGEAAGAAAPGLAPILSGCEPDYPPYCIVTPDDQADGFSVELLRAALKAMGREVVFKTGPWAELKQALADGKLEVLPLVGRTPEREALYDFTVPYLTMHGALFIRRDTADIRTWEDVKGKRVAVMKGDSAEEYVRRVHLSDRITTSPDFEGAFRMLADGRADAVVAQKLMGLTLLKHLGISSIEVVGRPSEEFAQTFSFAVRKGNGALLATLNEGLAIVMAEGINWKLERKWMGATARETALARVLICGGDCAFPPYEFLDEKGRPSGFNIELARAIARQIGVDISFQLAPWTEVRRKIENGEVDLACMFYSESRARLVEFAVPHTLVYQAVFARKDSPYRHMDDLKGRRISVQNGDIMHEYAVEHGLGDTLTVTATSEEALALLAKGRVDFALGTYLQGLHWFKQNGWRNLRAVETRLLGTEYCYATPKGNTALRDLFNDGLRQLKESGEYRRIYSKWLGVLEPGFERQQIARIMLFALVLATFLAAIAFGVIFTLRRQVRSRTRELSFKTALLEAQSEAAVDGILVVNDNGQTLLSNARFGQMWNIPADILATRDDKQMLDCVLSQLAEPQGFLDQVRYLYSHGTERSHDEVAFKDGRVFDRHSAPLSGTDGTGYGRVWYFRDISEQRRTHTELQSSRAFLDRVINAIADPVFVKDDKRRFVLVNDALCAIVGRPRERLLGEDGDDMFPADQVDVFRKMDARVYDTGEENLNEESLSNLTSGEVRTIVTRKSRYIDPAGKRFLVGVIRDFTERKQMEAQLRQQQKLASVGTLARGMAHEINNPIMGIINYAQLILDKVGPDGPVSVFAAEIGKEGERVATIVKGMLSFSRQEKETQRSPARLHDIVEGVRPLIRTAMRDDGITLEVDVPEDLPQVKCRTQQIQRVILDLLTNAREALNQKYPGHDGNKIVRVSAREMSAVNSHWSVVIGHQSSGAEAPPSVIGHRSLEKTGQPSPNDQCLMTNDLPSAAKPPMTTDARSANDQCPMTNDLPGGRWIRLTVEDHGPGIPENLRARIFDPFFTTKDRTKSAGLGLSISYGIVEDHGGVLSVESEIGQWTRFHLDLPAVEGTLDV